MATNQTYQSLATLSTAGFSAIELMVTVSIIALLTTLAAPSFTPLFESLRVRQTTELLQSSLRYAQSEAIKRGGQITMQKLPNNTNGCSTASSKNEWDCGWIVCHDTNNSGSCSRSETILQRIDTPANVQISRSSGGATIKLDRWGLVDGSWLGFSIVPLNKSTTHPGARGICMSSGGRIRIIPPEAIPCTG